MDDGRLIEFRAEMVPDLFPPNNVAPLRMRNRLRALHKVFVSLVCCHMLLLQPVRDRGSARPAACVDLVTSEVEEVVKSHTTSALEEFREHGK